jgi:hypothetical protein
MTTILAFHFVALHFSKRYLKNKMITFIIKINTQNNPIKTALIVIYFSWIKVALAVKNLI